MRCPRRRRSARWMVVPARRQCRRESGAPIRRTSVYGVPKMRRSTGSAAAQTAAAVAPASAARTSPSIVVMRSSTSVVSVLSTFCPQMSKHPLRDWETSERVLESGGFESRQRVLAAEPAVEASDSGARWLGVMYWQAVAGFTRGDRRASWSADGGRLRLLGGANLLIFGVPAIAVDAEAVSCRYPIQGGLLALRPGWLRHARPECRRRRVRAERHRRGVSAAARGAGGAPWWTGALYAKGQSPFHAAVSRRYFELLVRGRAG